MVEIEKDVFKPGFTWKVILAIIIAALFFLPASIFLNLIAGATAAGAAVYIIAIIFMELSRRFGSEITLQELFIIYMTVGAAAGSIPPYYWLIYRSFFVQSPFTRDFNIRGIRLIDMVPNWMSPPAFSQAHQLRTLFHPDWIPALTIVTLMSFISLICDLALAILFSKIFIEKEKLIFPFAHVNASLVTVLSERESESFRIFLYTLFVGAFLSGIIYLPYLTGIPAVPLPWVDLTYLTQTVLPGAAIGVATDPSIVIGAFVLPPYVTICSLISSLAIWVFGNSLFLTSFPTAFPEWVNEYYYGMSISLIYQRSNVRVWIPIQIGLLFGYALILIFLIRKSIFPAFKAIFQKKADYETEVRYPSTRLLLCIFTIGSLSSVLLFHYLVPEYPIYVPILISLGYSFFFSLVAVQAIGVIGQYPAIPWPWMLMTYFTPYEGYAGFTFSPYISLGGPAGLVQATKTAYLTKTKPLDYYKAYILAWVLALICGLIFMDFFWRLAPIPSNVYPYTIVYWPSYAISDAMYITRQIKINPTTILSGVGVSVAIGVIEYLFRKVGVPFSGISFITGAFILPPFAIMMSVGSLISRYVIPRFIGKERWDVIRNIFVAGYFAGTGISVGFGFALTLISRATWIWPW
ncbi:MAG: hypothetical protein QXW55_01525 [Candidatus Bathyarchaeia archaeon]